MRTKILILKTHVNVERNVASTCDSRVYNGEMGNPPSKLVIWTNQTLLSGGAVMGEIPNINLEPPLECTDRKHVLPHSCGPICLKTHTPWEKQKRIKRDAVQSLQILQDFSANVSMSSDTSPQTSQSHRPANPHIMAHWGWKSQRFHFLFHSFCSSCFFDVIIRIDLKSSWLGCCFTHLARFPFCMVCFSTSLFLLSASFIISVISVELRSLRAT